MRAAAAGFVLFACACATAPPRGVAPWLAPYDRDVSGTLDPAEVGRVPCPVWVEADAASRREGGMTLVARHGLEEGMWFQGLRIGLPLSSRQTARDAVRRCLGEEGEVSAVAAIVRGLDLIPATPAWDEVVATLLLTHFDAEGSGRIEREAEVTAIPCDVLAALNEAVLSRANAPFAAIYGISPGFEWVGGELGFAEDVRERLYEAVSRCLGDSQIE